MYQEIEGDLIKLALEGQFDVIAHGCNCFCKMGAGIAPQMAKAFGCNKFTLENPKFEGDINKLGQIDYEIKFGFDNLQLAVVNAYTQYGYNPKEKPFSYAAFELCMKKIAYTFPGKHIGLPMIGAGLAGGTWAIIKKYILAELRDNTVTIVIYKP